MLGGLKRLLEYAKHDQNSQIYPFIIVGLETSMRRMEILSIRWEHVDLQRLIIYFPKAKTGARDQPITRHLAEFMEGYKLAYQRIRRGYSLLRQPRKGTLWTFISLSGGSSLPPG